MSLAAFGGALQSVGDAGNQIAEGQLAAHRQKIADLFAALRLQQGQAQMAETEARTKKLGTPVPTPAEKAQQDLDAVERIVGPLSLAQKKAFFGVPAEPEKVNAAGIQEQIDRGLQALPEPQRKVVEPAVRGYLAAGQPDKALQVLSSVAEKFKNEPQTSEILKTKAGTPYGMKMGDKNIVPGMPEWTSQMQQVLDAGVKSAQDDEKEKEKLENKRQANALARAMQGVNLRKQQTLFTDYDKAKSRMTKWDHMQSVGDRADNYVAAPSGPGDVALLLAFADATKPESGFRFQRNEQEMIMRSRGLIEGAQAALAKGESGLLFGPVGSEQRGTIGYIVKQASNIAQKQKEGYMSGIEAINPDLYEILSNDTDDFVPDQ